MAGKRRVRRRTKRVKRVKRVKRKQPTVRLQPLTPDVLGRMVLKNNTKAFNNVRTNYLSADPKKFGAVDLTQGSYPVVIDLGQMHASMMSYTFIQGTANTTVRSYGGGALAPFNGFTFGDSNSNRCLISLMDRYDITNPSNVNIHFTAIEVMWTDSTTYSWVSLANDYNTNNQWWWQLGASANPIVQSNALSWGFVLQQGITSKKFIQFNQKFMPGKMKILNIKSGIMAPNQNLTLISKSPTDFQYKDENWTDSAATVHPTYHKNISKTWLLFYHGDLLGGAQYNADGTGEAGQPVLPIATKCTNYFRLRTYNPLYHIDHPYQYNDTNVDAADYANEQQFDGDNNVGMAVDEN